MKPRHGLVIGKFYPPHAGHELLVRTAASLCERVSVVVMAASTEHLPLAQRVGWLREIHAGDANVTVTGIVDDVPIDYHDDAVWRAHVELMRVATRELTAEPIDCVFTSEAYGPELGRRLNARHVAVDPNRELVPISGSALRANPRANWEFLAPCVRRDLTLRVILVGAESTGKTTLARRLATGAPWVAEYGREYTLYKLASARGSAQLQAQPAPGMEQLVWTSDDFVKIAAEQNRREDAAAVSSSGVLICDTDAFATGIWHARYCGQYSEEVDALAPPPARRLYLLTHPDDVPFTQDGIRDGETIRSWMTEQFVARLSAASYAWHWLRGAARLERAFALIERTQSG